MLEGGGWGSGMGGACLKRLLEKPHTHVHTHNLAVSKALSQSEFFSISSLSLWLFQSQCTQLAEEQGWGRGLFPYLAILG